MDPFIANEYGAGNSSASNDAKGGFSPKDSIKYSPMGF